MGMIFPGCCRTQLIATWAGVRPVSGDHPGWGVGEADVVDASLPDQIVQTPHHLFDRGGEVPHVEPEQIDMVGPEPLQAGPDGADQVLAVVSAEVRVGGSLGQGVLGGNDEPVPVSLHQIADDPLAGAIGVVAAGVDEVPARLGVCLEDRSALCSRCTPAPVITKGHGAQRQFGDPQTAGA